MDRLGLIWVALWMCGCGPAANRPCTSDSSCASGELCSSLDKVCVARCTVGQCGSGRSCNANSGQCEVAMCSPSCTAKQRCDTAGAAPACVARCTTGACATGNVCDTISGTCKAAPTCNSTHEQPAMCSYGQHCLNNTCVDLIHPPSCANFSGTSAPAWDTTSSAGPVIYSVKQLADDPTWCTGAMSENIQLEVKAYSWNAWFPEVVGSNQGFLYVRADSSLADATAQVRASGYTRSANEINATFNVNFCVAPGVASLPIGFYFTNGNAVCFTGTN